MNDRALFYSYGVYLKEKYGKPVFRVGVDAGFTCPRNGSGSCTYCESQGARAAYLRNENHGDLKEIGWEQRFASVGRQIESGIRFLKRRYKAAGFILYFQANTNTNGPVEELKSLFDHALSLEDFCGLAVSTRPDCLPPDVVELLASYQTDKREVWVELGLQSASDRLLASINRGHDRAAFLKACLALKAKNLPLVVHLILGLPGETRKDLIETMAFVASLNPRGIKLHNLHIPLNTAMYEEFLRGEITAPSSPRHLESLIFALERIPADTVVLRITCDTPGGPGAPRHFWNKSRLYDELMAEMAKRETRQGRIWEASLINE